MLLKTNKWFNKIIKTADSILSGHERKGRKRHEQGKREHYKSTNNCMSLIAYRLPIFFKIQMHDNRWW
jgi:hypothetical protein